MYEHESDFHRLKVTDDGAWRVLKFERNQQSSMALDDPFDSDIEYVAYLHLSMAVKPDALRTLVIGLGGGSVVKRMWRDYAPMHIDAVEIDQEVASVAREYFALPDDERINVHTGDGRAFLERTDQAYDLIIVDAFDDYDVPRLLKTEEFMRTARFRLTPGGVVAYNFIGRMQGDRSRPFRSLYRTLGNVFPNVWVFPIRPEVFITLTEDRNIVLFGTDVPITSDELLARIADRAGDRVGVTCFERFGEDLLLTPVRAGDVPILVDDPPKKRRGRRSPG